MGPLTSPGAQQTATDATTWVFKDPGEAKQLLAILLLGFLALIPWWQSRFPPEEVEDEQDVA